MVGAVAPRRARHLVTLALGSTSAKGARKGSLGATTQGTTEGSLGAAEAGHAWGGAARVVVPEEHPL